MFRSMIPFVLGLACAPVAFGQGPAGRKITGEVYWPAAQKQRHAYDYARVLNQAGRQTPTVAKATVQENVQAIRQNSEAAMKQFAKIKAAHADDKAVTMLVDSIEKHHAKALEMCSMLDEECKKGDAAGVTVCGCCLTMAKELDAATKDAEKLREVLKIEPLADPLKESATQR